MRSPVQNGLSLSSMSEVTRSAASASVRASTIVGTPMQSAASRAAISFSTASRVGTSTLPPMWPHFFTDASWSSKWTPAAPASIIAFISSNAFSTPPNPASASATIGAKKSMSPLPSMCWIWSARMNVLLIRRTTMRHRVDRIQRLVRIHLAGDVRVGGDLPAGQVDRLQAGLHLLHRLVAGHRAQRVDERLVVHQLPQLLGAAARERVLDVDRAAQAHDVFRRVAALDALPAGIFRPVLLESCRFQIVVHRLLPSCASWPIRSARAGRSGTLVSGPARATAVRAAVAAA